MTQVELDKESEFFYSDLVTAGRIGMGEKFAFRHYRSRVCVSVDGQPVWLEQCLLEPEQMDLTNMGFLIILRIREPCIIMDQRKNRRNSSV